MARNMGHETSGEERRRLDINHPELTPTSAEKEERKILISSLAFLGNIFCLLFMILATIFIVLAASILTGTTAFWFVFISMMLNITIALILALIIGAQIRKIRKELT